MESRSWRPSSSGTTLVALLTLCLLSAAPAFAEAPKVETVVEGLANPWGVVVRPRSAEVFVSDSGAGRVVRVRDGKVEDAITGFSTGELGPDQKHEIGPLGLAFLDFNTLVVGEGGAGMGGDAVRLFALPRSGGVKADQARQAIRPDSQESKQAAVGRFFSMAAVNESLIFFTCLADDASGAVARAQVEDGRAQAAQLLVESAREKAPFAPAALTTMPEQEHLLVASRGDSGGVALSFHSARTGKRLMLLSVGLRDVTSLAYSPQGLLYATDISWSDPERSGLYRLDAAGERNQEVRSTLILPLKRPTAMAFAPDGALYVTLAGESEASAPSGSLVRITGEL